jgi:hypothetical protein
MDKRVRCGIQSQGRSDGVDDVTCTDVDENY